MHVAYTPYSSSAALLEAGKGFHIRFRFGSHTLSVLAGDDVLDIHLKRIPAQDLLARLVLEHLFLRRVEAAGRDQIRRCRGTRGLLVSLGTRRDHRLQVLRHIYARLLELQPHQLAL